MSRIAALIYFLACAPPAIAQTPTETRFIASVNMAISSLTASLN